MTSIAATERSPLKLTYLLTVQTYETSLFIWKIKTTVDSKNSRKTTYMYSRKHLIFLLVRERIYFLKSFSKILRQMAPTHASKPSSSSSFPLPKAGGGRRRRRLELQRERKWRIIAYNLSYDWEKLHNFKKLKVSNFREIDILFRRITCWWIFFTSEA